MIDGCDDPYTIYNPHKPTRAAKEHKCAECFRPIAVGETYYRATGLYDGQWDTHHTCSHCYVACQWLVDNCGGFLHGGVDEDIYEHVRDYRRPDLLRLVVGIRRKWQRKRGAGLRQIPRLPRPIAIGDAA
jgi:hypothetical protein